MEQVAVSMCCTLLVRTFASRSAGSGIPEIKVVLGGFDMARLLSGWTLLIKSLGLVMSVGAGPCSPLPLLCI